LASKSKDALPSDLVAGGGLVNRRQLLGAGVAASGLAMTGQARADVSLPEWVTQAGETVRGYGMPAPEEGYVQRALIRPYADLAPGFSFSGTPLQYLRGSITPNGLHFEVHHGGRPLLDAHDHRLMIHGLVERPLQFDLAALERYPMVSNVHFLECAGNSGRNASETGPPQVAIDQLHGLVSNAEWTGVPFNILLDEAGIKPEGKWVVAIGDDGPGMARSIPIEKMMGDGILALYQNGERLRPEQGYPMRLLLPGYEGNMNVKWVTSLFVTDAPAHTKSESGEYSELLADGQIAQFTFGMGVKSLITHPSALMRMQGPGFYEISGLAWSGAGKIAGVEVSADGGQTWADAELAGPVLSRALTRFRIPWIWDGAPTALMSRAIDETGAVQPTRTAWKAKYAPSNYLHYNAIQPWRINAQGEVDNVYL
jgi:sulfane dehydrogenase subunit SoxC